METLNTIWEETNERKLGKYIFILFGINANDSEVKHEIIDNDVEKIKHLSFEVHIHLNTENIKKTQALGNNKTSK